MTPLRCVLAPLIAVSLFCQTGAVASGPLALWFSAAHPHAEDCTCGHGDGAMCPMHHKPTGKSAPCVMRSTNTAGMAILTTLVGVAAPVVESIASIRPAISSKDIPNGRVDIIGERPVPPDPPPPRL